MEIPTDKLGEEEPRIAQELALKRYDVLFRYLAYENTIYWTRNQFFLASQVALIVFATAKLPPDPSSTKVASLFVPVIIVFCGFVLTILWLKTLTAAEHWIDRWHSLCIDLEPAAFDNQYVLRRSSRDKGRPDRIKRLARYVIRLFVALWGAISCYLLFCIAQRVSLKF